MLFRLSEPVKDRVRTITADCGKEVTGYATVTWALALECHLARPPVGAPAERIREGIGATVLIEVEEIQSSASRGGCGGAGACQRPAAQGAGALRTDRGTPSRLMVRESVGHRHGWPREYVPLVGGAHVS